MRDEGNESTQTEDELTRREIGVEDSLMGREVGVEAHGGVIESEFTSCAGETKADDQSTPKQSISNEQESTAKRPKLQDISEMVAVPL